MKVTNNKEEFIIEDGEKKYNVIHYKSHDTWEFQLITLNVDFPDRNTITTFEPNEEQTIKIKETIWRFCKEPRKHHNKGWLHKSNDIWMVKWSDLQSFTHGTHWNFTPLIYEQQSLPDLVEGTEVEYEIEFGEFDKFHFTFLMTARIIF